MNLHAADASPVAAPALASEERWLVWLIVAVLAVRIATLGAYPLMDNTEARYAEIARKMLETGDWVTPQVRYGVAFWSKPPLSTWLTAATFAVLGVGEFAARLASVLPSLGVLWLVYALAAARGRRDGALRAVAVLATTPDFFLSAGAVMTDPALVFGTTLSMAGFWFAMTRDGPSARVWGYLFFAGLAIGLLAKGPVGVVLTMLPIGVWTLWKGGIRNVWERVPWVSGTLLTALVVVPWYVAAESRTPGYLDYFIVGEHFKRYLVPGWQGDLFGTAHVRPRGTIWLFAFLTTLPWCAVWLALYAKLRRVPARASAAPDDGWNAYLWLWLLASPVFFTPAPNILPTYVLPALPAFALLVAQAWTAAADAGREGSARYYGLVMPVLMVAAVLFALPRIAPGYTQKTLVAEYIEHRTSADARLVYLGLPPLSAEFYARGKVATAPSADALRQMIAAAGGRDFVVLTDAQRDADPALAAKLVPLARAGRYQLFQAK
jgi:4-amino-4-deoxy-L-arabinose transferase-like glycosyltransferase